MLYDIVCEGAPVDNANARPPKPPRLAASTDAQLTGVVDFDRQLTSAAMTRSADDGGPVVTPVSVSLAACRQPDAGLGFDVIGDETGAVFVGQVFDRGPAALTGKIRPGESATIGGGTGGPGGHAPNFQLTGALLL